MYKFKVKQLLLLSIITLGTISTSFGAFYDRGVAGSNSLNIESAKLGNVSGNSGSFNYSYSIVVPPGANGWQPSIGFTYNSQNKDNLNFAGYGWNLNLQKIERKNVKGINEMYLDDNFTSNVFGDLVKSDTDTTLFVPKRSGTYVQIKKVGDTFEVLDKSGNLYIYGQGENSKIVNSAGDKIFAWYLTESRNIFGATIKYEYTKYGDSVYIQNIKYGSVAGNNPSHEIRFSYENRNDVVASYKTGFKLTTPQRLYLIESWTDGVKNKEYNFRYGVGVNGTRSILLGIIEKGFMGGSVIQKPEETFEYSQRMVGVDISQNIPNQNVNGINKNDWDRITDIDGDGDLDLVKNTRVCPNSSIGCSPSDPYYQNLYPQSFESYIYENKNGQFIKKNIASSSLPLFSTRFSDTGNTLQETNYYLDINNDNIDDSLGYAGIAGFATTSATTSLLNYISTSTNAGVDGYNFILTDFDGDGASEYVKVNNSGSYNFYQVKENKAGKYENIINIENLNANRNNAEIIFDMNADGLTDLYNGQSSQMTGQPRIYNYEYRLNNGQKVLEMQNVATETLPIALQKDTYTTAFNDLFVYDYNYDGLNDLVNKIGEIWENVGNTFVKNTTLLNNYSSVTNTDRLVADLNGDGLQDAYWLTNTGQKMGYFSKEPSDTLKKIKTSDGGVQEVNYKTNTKYEEYENKSPISTFIVASTTVKNGFGNEYKTEYEFKGMKQNFKNSYDKENTGFREVKIKKDNGGKVLTKYSQDEKTVGEIIETNIFGVNDENLQISKNEIITLENNFTKNNVNNKAYINLVGTTTNKMFAQSGNILTQDVFNYDDKYDLVKNVKFGEVVESLNASGTSVLLDKNVLDNRIVKYEYARKSDNSYISKVQKATSFVGDESVVNGLATTSVEFIKYDNLGTGNMSLGLPTEKNVWFTDATNTREFYEYNNYGNLIKSKDINNNETTYNYDAENIYINNIVNPLGQSSYILTDKRTGQKTQENTQDGKGTRNIYDGLGRIKEIRIMDDRLLKSYEYIYTPYLVVIENNFFDNTYFKSNKKYFDGLGRVIKEENALPDNRKAISESKYNEEGKVVQKTLPYEEGVNSTTLEKLRQYMEYDTIGRLVKKRDTLGEENIYYDGLKTSSFNKKQKQKDVFSDVWGNVSEIHEYNLGSVYNTKYEYDEKGKVKKITDAENGIRNLSYDYLGNLLSDELTSRLASSTTSTFSYNLLGQKVFEKYANGDELHFEYDKLGRPVKEISLRNATITIPLTATTSMQVATVTKNILGEYFYDNCNFGIGFLCNSKSTSTEKTFEYNILGQNIKENTKVKLPNSTTTLERSIIKNYDLAGNILQEGDGVATTTYNFRDGFIDNVLFSYKATSTKVAEDIFYNTLGQPKSFLRGGLIETGYEYDADEMYRLKSRRTGVPYLIQDINQIPKLDLTGLNLTFATTTTFGYKPTFLTTFNSGYSMVGAHTATLIPGYHYPLNDKTVKSGTSMEKYPTYDYYTGRTSFLPTTKTFGLVFINTYDSNPISYMIIKAMLQNMATTTLDLVATEKRDDFNDSNSYIQVFKNTTFHPSFSDQGCDMATPYSDKFYLNQINLNATTSIPLNQNFKNDAKKYAGGSDELSYYARMCIFEGHSLANTMPVDANDLRKSLVVFNPNAIIKPIVSTMYGATNTNPIANIKLKDGGQGMFLGGEINYNDKDGDKIKDINIWLGEAGAFTSTSTNVSILGKNFSSSTLGLSDFTSSGTKIFSLPYNFSQIASSTIHIFADVIDELGGKNRAIFDKKNIENINATTTSKVYCLNKNGKIITEGNIVGCDNFTFDIGMPQNVRYSIPEYQYTNFTYYIRDLEILLSNNQNVASSTIWSVKKTINEQAADINETKKIKYTGSPLSKNVYYYLVKAKLNTCVYNTCNGYNKDVVLGPYAFYVGDYSLPENAKYTYDVLGNIETITDKSKDNPKDANFKNNKLYYTYDDLNRLLKVDESINDAAVNGKEFYNYSPVGNILSSHKNIYNYNDVLTHAPVAINNLPQTYDSRGRLLDDGKNKYNWNEQNRLTSATTTTGKVMNYFYDNGGQRVLSLASTTEYLFTPGYFVNQDKKGDIIKETYTLNLGTMPIALAEVSKSETIVASTSLVTSTTTTMQEVATITYITVSTTTRSLVIKVSTSTPIEKNTIGQKENILTTSAYDEFLSTDINPVYIYKSNNLNNVKPFIGRKNNIQNKQTLKFDNLIKGVSNNFIINSVSNMTRKPFYVNIINGSTTAHTKSFTFPNATKTLVTAFATRTVSFTPITDSITIEIESRQTTGDHYFYIDSYDTNVRYFKTSTSTKWVTSTGTYEVPQISTSTIAIETPTTTEITEYITISSSTEPTFTYPVTDHLLSTQKLLSSTGTLLQNIVYSSYGEETKSSPTKLHRTFTNHEKDEDTNLIYARARYLDTNSTNFLSVDPVVLNNSELHSILSDPQSLNSYTYARRNPVNMVDPDGREPVKALAGTTEDFLNQINVISERKVGQFVGQNASNYLSSLPTYKFIFSKLKLEPTQTPFYNNKIGRYIYTENGGWIDMSHFMFYAGRAYNYKKAEYKNPVVKAVKDGNRQEMFDSVRSSRSGYSYEDLPSDYYGADFGANFFDADSKMNLSQQLDLYLTFMLGATKPENAPNYKSIPEEDDPNKKPSFTNKTIKPYDFKK